MHDWWVYLFLELVRSEHAYSEGLAHAEEGCAGLNGDERRESR